MSALTAGTRTPSLLIVDDSAAHRQYVMQLCHQIGVDQVHEAEHGAHALEVLDRLAQPPQLLIIDLEMPVMDGVELIQQMHRRNVHIPFIIASNRESSLVGAVEVMARALGLPVVAGVRKPLTVGLLREAFGIGARSGPPRPAAAPTEADIDAAMLGEALDTHAITLNYQPKVDIRSGVLRGVEALARWSHPERGPMRPDRFIAAAEHHGLIHRLTLAVMEQAMAQASRWNARGLRITVAVNLSPRLLDAPELVGEIAAMLARHALSAEQVVLEITESSVAGSQGAALATLARLRMRGFGLSIDDYGTGFSAMQQLARIPFTELKIDRSFVHGAYKHDNLQVLLQSALEMASRLGLVTVAEGVETLEDWRLLQRFGCNIGQGWLVAKAMPATTLPRWLRQHEQHGLPRLRPTPHASPTLP